MLSEREQREQKKIVYKICSDVLNDRVKNLEEIYKMWPEELNNVEFYKEIFENMIDYYEHIPVGSRQKEFYQTTDQFLNFYTAYKVLEYDKDTGTLREAYRETIKIGSLTKEKVDENLKKILQEKRGHPFRR